MDSNRVEDFKPVDQNSAPDQNVPNNPSHDHVTTGPNKRGKGPFLLIVVLVLLALIGVGLLIHNHNDKKVVYNAKPKLNTVQNTEFGADKIQPAQVSITNTGFTPSSIQVKVGQAVVWTNSDKVAHYVISDNPNTNDEESKLNSGSAIAPGKDYNFVFNNPGTFAYHDSVNAKFVGEVTVVK